MNKHEKWMKLALNQAIKAERNGEIPVGAVLVNNEKLIAASHNQPISTNDATAHAEIQLIRNAGRITNNYRLTGSSIYVTLEPCAMCLGALVHARVAQIIFGAYDSKSGVCGTAENLIDARCFNHKIHVEGGVLENESIKLLQRFFRSRR